MTPYDKQQQRHRQRVTTAVPFATPSLEQLPSPSTTPPVPSPAPAATSHVMNGQDTGVSVSRFVTKETCALLIQEVVMKATAAERNRTALSIDQKQCLNDVDMLRKM
ncbi:hypothetical protein DM01DRAFT_1370334 [Hesseltinella vesiculosa]|uniref:Uncharacterized protein n=1 Tax=Hesseltinella vesiculosa TaxID=101127 RepID=A0A1X2GWP6_9FUNG|nr:hypothetical protein DM01DRAFT_1370334 [Hesseltinella vesiculosa]